MKITVDGYAAVTHAEIDLPTKKIALVGGHNGDGKTSLAEAVIAVATGEALPIGVTKKEIGVLVHSGSPEGKATIESAGSMATMQWPTGELSSAGGRGIHVNDFGVGRQSFMRLDESQRRSLLSAFFAMEPTETRTREAITAVGYTTEEVDKIWGAIKTKGWDSVWKTLKEHGIKMKGQWEVIAGAGQRWGSKLGGSWLPAGWEQSLMAMSGETLESELEARRVQVEDAIAHQAVSEDRLATLKVDAEGVVTAEAAHALAITVLETERAKLVGLKDDLTKLPPEQTTMDEYKCPHCGEGIVFKDVKPGVRQLAKAEEVVISDDINKKRRVARQTKQTQITNQELVVTNAQTDVATALSRVSVCKAASAQYSTALASNVSADRLDAARVAHTAADTRLKAFNAKRDADRLHTSIIKNQSLIDLIDESGLRTEAAQLAIGEINKKLFVVGGGKGWKAPVGIANGLELRFGGWPYARCSRAQRFVCDVVMQLMIAEMSGTELVVIDGMDILDDLGRAALMKTIAQVGIAALVTMTHSKKDTMPKLPESLGGSYWIENGELEPL